MDHLPRIHDLTKSVAQSSSFTHNAVLRKLRAKLLTRIALRLLPARSTTRKRGQHICVFPLIFPVLLTLLHQGRALLVDKHTDQETEEEEFDVPEEVEDVLGELFSALQDRVGDTLNLINCVVIYYRTGYRRSLVRGQGCCSYRRAITHRLCQSSSRHCDRTIFHPFARSSQPVRYACDRGSHLERGLPSLCRNRS